MVCMEKPRYTTKNGLTLINQFRKVEGYKVNIQKALTEREIKEEIHSQHPQNSSVRNKMWLKK